MQAKLAALLLSLMAIATPGNAITLKITHATATVGVASASALAAVASGATARIFVYLENDSDTAIYCKWGATAVVNQGMKLAATGTTGDKLMFTPLTGVPQVILNCISAGASKNLLITTGTQTP